MIAKLYSFNCAFFLLVIVSICCFSACSFKMPSMPGTGGFSPASAEEKAELLRQLTKHSDEIHSARAQFVSKVKRGLAEDVSTEVLVFDRPDMLRLEIFATAMNRLAAMIVVRRSFLHAVNTIQKKVYRGTASMENFEQIISVPFVPEQFVLWLTGRFAPPGKDEQATYEALINKEKGEVFLTFGLKEQRTVVLHANTSECKLTPAAGSPEQDSQYSTCMSLKAYEMRRSGSTVFYSSFTYDASKPGQPLAPSRIDFWLPEKQVHGEISFKDVEFNPNLTADRDKLFVGRASGGVEIISLDNKIHQSVDPLL
jgi:hypothetical protein